MELDFSGLRKIASKTSNNSLTLTENDPSAKNIDIPDDIPDIDIPDTSFDDKDAANGECVYCHRIVTATRINKSEMLMHCPYCGENLKLPNWRILAFTLYESGKPPGLDPVYTADSPEDPELDYSDWIEV